jgi:hypothetical protein
MTATQVKGRMRSDTRAILRVSGTIEIVGIACAIAVWASGGMTSHGPHGNLGWFALIVALGCIPTGSFFLLLGFAKWLGDRNRTE